MKALLVIGIWVTLFSSTMWAQGKQCGLSFSDVSAIRGLRLGMTSEQVVSLLGNPSVRDNGHIGYTPQSFNDEKSQVVGLVDVDQIQLSLSQNQVSGIFINYKPVVWGSAREYADAVSEKLNLPKLWKYRAAEAEMVCRDFSLKLDASVNSLTLLDLTGINQEPADHKGKGAAIRKN